MAEILLINSIIREFAPPNNPPLGLLYIAAVLEQHGHKCDICDLNALRQINPDREYWLRQYMRPYDYVGLSGLIVTYQEQKSYLEFIAKHRKAFGYPVLISGGGLATSVPDFVFKNMPELSVLVIGEGEETMLDLANGLPLADIPGTQGRIGTIRFKSKPRELISDLDELPFPAWDKVPVEDVYLGNAVWGGDTGNSSRINYVAKKSMSMIVSRGCPHNCNFCASSVMGKKYRMRSVSNVVSEMKTLKHKYDVDFIGMVDDNTTANRLWTMNFCEALIKEDLGIKWGCSARVDQVDPALLSVMKASGCEFIGFGVESGSPEILKRMNKKADPVTAANAIQMVRDADIFANATFICGYPGETRDTIRMTAKFMKDNDCLGNMFYATAYPGTVLYDESKDKILSKYGTEDAYIKDLCDATDFKVNLSEMSDDELIECRQMAIEGRSF